MAMTEWKRSSLTMSLLKYGLTIQKVWHQVQSLQLRRLHQRVAIITAMLSAGGESAAKYVGRTLLLDFKGPCAGKNRNDTNHLEAGYEGLTSAETGCKWAARTHRVRTESLDSIFVLNVMYGGARLGKFIISFDSYWPGYPDSLSAIYREILRGS